MFSGDIYNAANGILDRGARVGIYAVQKLAADCPPAIRPSGLADTKSQPESFVSDLPRGVIFAWRRDGRVREYGEPHHYAAIRSEGIYQPLYLRPVEALRRIEKCKIRVAYFRLLRISCPVEYAGAAGEAGLEALKGSVSRVPQRQFHGLIAHSADLSRPSRGKFLLPEVSFAGLPTPPT